MLKKAIVGIIAIGASVGVLAGCGGSTTENNTETTTISAETTSATTTESTSEVTTESTEQVETTTSDNTTASNTSEKKLSFETPDKEQSWDLTVTDLKYYPTLPVYTEGISGEGGESTTYEASDKDKQFVVLYVNMKNTGTKSQYVNSIDSHASYKIIYDDKYEFNGSYFTDEINDKGEANMASLVMGYDVDALSDKDGIMAFEVPKEVIENTDKPLKLRVCDPLNGGKTIAELDLK